MIWESHYWKQPLLEMADRLRHLAQASEIADEQYVQLEKDIFIGFYSIRKLVETTTKITDTTREKTVELRWHANKTQVNWRNNHRIDELYDMERSHQETRNIWFVSSRIVHSFIFMPYANADERLAGVLFTSDTDKDKKLYSMSIEKVIEIFELVGNDDPVGIHWSRDPDSGDETMVVE